MIIAVIGNTEKKRKRLIDGLNQCEAARGRRIHSFESLKDAKVKLGRQREDVDVAILCVAERRGIGSEIKFARDVFHRGRIVVDLPLDLPEMGFEALEHGARCVDYQLAVNGDPQGKLCDYITRIAGENQQAAEIYRKNWTASREKPDSWGFMSMNFDRKSKIYNDYRSAIRVATKRAGVSLERADEICRDEPHVISVVQSAIRDRNVFVFDMSDITHNTMYEFGYADAAGKSMLCIRRLQDNHASTKDDTGIPTLLRSFVPLEYSTLTELALRFFFTIGGLSMDNAMPSEKGRILIIVPIPVIAATLNEILRSNNRFNVDEARDLEDATSLVNRRIYDATIVDLDFGGRSGTFVLDQLRVSQPGLPGLFLCPPGDIGRLSQELNVAPGCFLAKPFRDDAVIAAVDNIIALSSFRQVVTAHETGDDPFSGILGKSDAIEKTKEQCRKCGRSQSSVLLRGETGTGKELFAKAVHSSSPRWNQQYVIAHVSAVAPTLVESALFGHVKGAFNGADRSRLGWFKEADRGTLFLDEIGETSLDVQQKLLRVMERYPFRPLGADRDATSDVRIIAATKRDIKSAVESGQMRDDFFYRFDFSVVLPPLRERYEDVEELARHFARLDAPDVLPKSVLPEIENDVIPLLKSYNWPGNIRELRRVIRRALVKCNGKSIAPDDIEFDSVQHPQATTFQLFELPWKDAKSEFEKRYFERLSRFHGNDSARMAEAAQIDVTGITDRIRKFGLRDKADS